MRNTEKKNRRGKRRTGIKNILQSQMDVGKQGFTVTGQDMHHGQTHTEGEVEEKKYITRQTVYQTPLNRGRTKGIGLDEKVKEMKNSTKGVTGWRKIDDMCTSNIHHPQRERQRGMSMCDK